MICAKNDLERENSIRGYIESVHRNKIWAAKRGPDYEQRRDCDMASRKGGKVLGSKRWSGNI